MSDLPTVQTNEILHEEVRDGDCSSVIVFENLKTYPHISHGIITLNSANEKELLLGKEVSMY